MQGAVGPVGMFRGASSQYEEVRTVVEGITSTEGRVAVTGAVLLVTLVAVSLLAPVVIRRTNAAVLDRLPTGRTRTTVELISDYVPTTLGELFLRVVQFTLLVLAVLTLLMVWGLVDAAVWLLRILGLSLPLFVQVIATLALLLFGYIAIDLLEDGVKQFSEGADRITEHQEEIVLRLGHIGVLVFAFGAILTIWGVNLSGLLVGAGFLGIVVGLAARETLGAIIAGFVLMFSRPFTIGDWVEVGGHEGIVTDITIINTHMRNFDGESIVIPNDNVSNEPIINRSKQGHLRIRLEVGIDYGSDPEHAEDVALEAIESVDVISQTPPPAVIPKAFGDSAVVLEMRFWIDRPTPPRRWRATEDVIHAVKTRFEAEGIKIPYPQRELSGRAETGGFRVQGSELGTGRPDSDVIREGHQSPAERSVAREDERTVESTNAQNTETEPENKE